MAEEAAHTWAHLIPEGEEIGLATSYYKQVDQLLTTFEMRKVDTGNEMIGELSYYFFAPEGAEESDETYPLIMILHGGNADPNAADSVEGVIWASEVRQAMLGGAYLVYPIAGGTAGSGWSTKDDDGVLIHEAVLLSVIDDLVTNAKVDPDKVAIGSCSIGGYMLWNILMNNPDTFACAFMQSAAWDRIEPTEEDFARIDEIDKPLWILHSEMDEVATFDEHVEQYVDEFESIDNIRFTRFDWIRYGNGKIASHTIPANGAEDGQHRAQYAVGQNMIFDDGTPYDTRYPDGFAAWLLECFAGEVVF